MARSIIAGGTFGGIAGPCARASLLGCALVLAGTPAVASEVLSGEVFYRERVALPPSAELEVTLLDITRPNRLGDFIASVRVKAKNQPPIPFQIRFGGGDIEPDRHYIVHARIVADGRLLFVSAMRTRVLTHGHPASVRILMAAISSPEADKGRQSLIGRTWRTERIGETAAMDHAPATLSFDAAGGASGSGGCNRLSTSVQIDGSSLTFGAIATTRRMCDPAVMDQEATFLLALERTRQFRVEGSRLVLLDRAGVELVRLAGGP